MRQRRVGQLLQRALQGRLRRLQPLGFPLILQRPHHLRQPDRRRRHVRRIPRKVHTAGHIVQRLLLHQLLDLAGVAKPQHRRAADHQRHHHHQQVKDEQSPACAGEKVTSLLRHITLREEKSQYDKYERLLTFCVYVPVMEC